MQPLANRHHRAGDPDVAADAGSSKRAHAWLDHAPVVLGLIALYLAGHFLLRLALSPTLGIDDAEQILFAQQWALGYRFRQPPLFTWLLVPLIDGIGPGIVAISIVRYVFLAITYGCLYLTALHWIDDRRLAALSVLSFASIYVFAYYAHHDLTHTTALSAMIAATFLAFTKLVRRPTTLSYMLLGVVFGLGMLTKWNFVMLALGLPLTCLLLPAYRPLILDKRSLLAIAIMALIVAPTALWMFSHGQTAGTVSGDILNGGGALGQLERMVDGSIALSMAILLFPTPFLPLFLVLFGHSLVRDHGHRRGEPVSHADSHFLGLLILVILGLHALLIPFLGAVTFTERWMHPALQILPIFLFARLQHAPPTRRRISIYLCMMGILVAVVVGARLYRYAEGADACGKCREFAPFAELADGLRAAGFEGGTILADGMHMGGNLRVAFPESRIIDPAFPLDLWPGLKGRGRDENGMCLLVWRDDQPDTDLRRDRIIGFARNELGMPTTSIGERGRIEAKLYNSSNRHYALGFELIRENPGACR